MTDSSNLSRRSMLKGVVGMSALLASGPLLAACSSSTKAAAGGQSSSAATSAAAAASAASSSSASSAPAKLDTVTCQLGWKKLAQFGGHFAAIQQGYFAQNGIDAKFLSGGPNIDPVGVVSNGQADIGDDGGSDILLANSKGMPITAFATIYQQTPNALMSLESNPITKLTDMVGKKIGLPSTENSLLKAMLIRAGVDPSKVKMVPVGTDPSVLTSKQVDGYLGYGTEQGLSLQQSGAKVNIIYFAQLGDPDYGNALFAKTSDITAKADILTRWLKADIAGWKYFTENPEAVAEYVWNQFHTETGAVLADQKVSAKAAVPLITAGDAATHGLMWINQASFETVFELYKTSGVITKDVDMAKVMTQSILIAAGDKA